MNTKLAYKLNTKIIKTTKTPHERDLAKMRMNIIRKAKKDMNQTNIFDFIYDTFRFDISKPIDIFEAFSGYGSQRMALERCGAKVNVVGMSDWWIPANIVYHALHGDKTIEVKQIDNKENLIIELLKYGLSQDDKKPMAYENYARKSIEWLQNIYKIIIQNKNYGAIGTFACLPYGLDLCTWSFPCQDISLAGNQKGMVDGSKSNYGYVFLETVKNTPKEHRPKVLLMENVKALFTKTFSEDWREIQYRLEEMGYTNYAHVMNSKDYGVAQSRDRVFIVSILGEHYYEFPKKYELTKKLKDYLEDDVDEMFYLNENFIKQMIKDVEKYNRKDKFLRGIMDGEEIARTITTKLDRPESNYILIPEATIQGYALAQDGDDVGVVLIDKTIIDLHSSDGFRRKPQKEISPTIMTDTRLTVLEKYGLSNDNVLENKIITIENKTYIVGIDGISLFRIRKLTPREALRLMDVEEEKINIILKTVSNSIAYKLAGNSIVVNVLVEIFKNLYTN